MYKSILFCIGLIVGISLILAHQNNFVTNAYAAGTDERLQKVEVERGFGYAKDTKTGLCFWYLSGAVGTTDCKFFDKAK